MSKKIRVCNSGACTSFGADDIMQTITESTALEPGQKNDVYDVDYCGCLGWCSNSPNVEVDDTRIIMDSEPNTIMHNIDSGKGKNVTSETITIVPITDDFLGDI